MKKCKTLATPNSKFTYNDKRNDVPMGIKINNIFGCHNFSVLLHNVECTPITLTITLHITRYTKLYDQYRIDHTIYIIPYTGL